MGHKPVLLWVPYRHMRPQSPHVTACPPARRCQEDVVRKKWPGVKKKLSGRSRQEEVVVRKLFTRKCVKTKIVLIVEVNCMDKKTTEQETPQHARRHLHPMNATSTSRSWHTTHLCEKLGYTGGVWLHKCRLNKCAARKCFNHNRYRFVWWASNNLVFGAYLKNTPQPYQLGK